jgi:uncharacterized membrane protein YcgQ (UPF0703/DUF1980 family)
LKRQKISNKSTSSIWITADVIFETTNQQQACKIVQYSTSYQFHLRSRKFQSAEMLTNVIRCNLMILDRMKNKNITKIERSNISEKNKQSYIEREPISLMNSKYNRIINELQNYHCS